MALLKYKFYKQSEIEWLDKIPASWHVNRMKFLTKIKTGSKDTVDREDNAKYPFFVRSENIERISSYSFDGEAILTSGDGAGVGKIFHYFMGKFDYHQRVYKLSDFNSQIKGKYLYFYLKTFFYDYIIKLSAKSTVDSVRLPMLQNFPVLVPHIKEQEKIVNYLEKKSQFIDNTIQKKQQLIELLKEQKAILINRAVTQGLNPDVPMKDSGVAWIGEIPAHWNVIRAKFLFIEIDERSETGQEELLSVSHLTGVTPRSEKNVSMFMAEDYSGSKLCKPDDLIINIMWAWMGALGVSHQTGIISPSYGVYRQKKKTFNSWFLEHLLQSNQYVAEYNRRSTGLHSSRLRLYSHMFFDMELGFPSLEEQNQIELFTTKKLEKINQILQATEKQIAKLNEFKQTLIAQAVTGKIKV